LRNIELKPRTRSDIDQQVGKLNLKALWVPDRKRILIDGDEPPLKHRWNEAHEIGHSIIPWHEIVLHGDNHRTLKPACHHAVEAEANYAAGRTLFLQDRFQRELLDSPIYLDSIKRLHKTFGNTITSTLWRAIEHMGSPALGVVHPHYLPENFAWVSPCRYFIRSPAFAAQFSTFTGLDAFTMMQSYCTWKRREPLGEAELVIDDDSGQSYIFFFESFCNTYDTLTLATYRRQHAMVVGYAGALV